MATPFLPGDSCSYIVVGVMAIWVHLQIFSILGWSTMVKRRQQKKKKLESLLPQTVQNFIMKQRYFLHLKCQSPEDPRNTHMSWRITSLLLSSTVTGRGEEQGNRGGDTEDEDLQSPQSRRKIAAVNANAGKIHSGPWSLPLWTKVQRAAQGPVPYQGTSRAAVQRRK